MEVLRKYGLIPVMEGADFMYYDKEEYTDEVNWYASLITESLGEVQTVEGTARNYPPGIPDS